jgi:hypothetical protein
MRKLLCYIYCFTQLLSYNPPWRARLAVAQRHVRTRTRKGARRAWRRRATPRRAEMTRRTRITAQHSRRVVRHARVPNVALYHGNTAQQCKRNHHNTSYVAESSNVTNSCTHLREPFGRSGHTRPTYAVITSLANPTWCYKTERETVQANKQNTRSATQNNTTSSAH